MSDQNFSDIVMSGFNTKEIGSDLKTLCRLAEIDDHWRFMSSDNVSDKSDSAPSNREQV